MSSTSHLPVVWGGPGRVLRMDEVQQGGLTRPRNTVRESGLCCPLPPRKPTAEAGNADSAAGFLCCRPGEPQPLYTALFIRDGAWAPLPASPQPPTKTLSDQSLCGTEWRQETVTPPGLGRPCTDTDSPEVASGEGAVSKRKWFLARNTAAAPSEIRNVFWVFPQGPAWLPTPGGAY